MLKLTDELMSQLEQVNSEINSGTAYRTDMDLYGRSEFWETAHGEGDCEDYAIAKRKRLRALGWPSSALRLATCKDETGGGHAVLTVDTDRGTLVLDNRFPNIERWEDLTVHGYNWDRRQAASGQDWVKIGY